ncbi:Single-stranded DNA-binding protein [Sulfurovum sp. enrichment culture clone C5]|uniref:Single-stranded DNA-binding protein n=1 Tax=Sulfurovum sp. enrichment culture clone C5 TaxID=497650 RepID=A0A0S4XLF8_9BACT|nr:Single-stranded DNA-binding protein [Sulfurovum sp. enrichment culture clone C5]
MFNKVILAGNLARDIEIRYLPSGTAVATTAIATNRRYKAADGTQKDETMFIDLTFWGRTAEIANQYLKKGSQVLVEGRLTLEQWTATDGGKRSKHAIAVETLQMLGSRDQSTGMSNNAPAYSSEEQGAVETKQSPTEHTIPEIDINDDEIPF